MTSPVPSTFTSAFSRRLQSVHSGDGNRQSTSSEFPGFDYSKAADLKCLIQRSSVQSFTVGTGASIFTQTLLPAILSAQHEVILVTCFWAASKTLTTLSRALEELAAKRQAQLAQNASLPTLQVRICLSSRSLFQQLFHTPSSHGYQYPPETWTSKLGLPAADVLAAGNIEVRIKSLFFLPFSVVHPKFLVVDRQRAFLPSCNVSWEAWLEGCIEISRTHTLKGGEDDAVDGLLEFYRRVWDRDYIIDRDHPQAAALPAALTNSALVGAYAINSPAHCPIDLQGTPISQTVWLPSPHHRNPRFRLFPWLKAHPPPSTPLNIALLQLFETAETDIYIQTPDITSPPVLNAILEAMERGVSVTIVTSRDMKIHEQLLTAGTTTTRCVNYLVAQYKKAASRKTVLPSPHSQDNDLEAQLRSPGHLKVAYFRPRQGVIAEEEPVHSHLKVTIVDNEFTVLGSGNMDRASWYTSQELGILFQSTQLAERLRTVVNETVTDRLDIIFESMS